MTAQAQPQTEQAIAFLICSERSGSNLISAILGAHSGVYSPPPYHFARDVLLNLHTAGTQTPLVTDAWKRLGRRAVESVRRLRTEEAAQRLEQWLQAKQNLSPVELARFFYCEMEAEAAGKQVFVKENNLHRVLFFLLHCFPQARFVFQVRDPRDYLASAKARKEGRFGNKFGSNRNAMNIWYEDQLGGLSALGLLGPERVFFQRYEDLVGAPQAVLPALCDFLGLVFEPTMLDFHQSSDAQQLASTNQARENIARPLMSDNFGKYRGKLSEREIRMVETYLGPLMDRFGYQRDFPKVDKPAVMDVLRPQFMEPIERYANKERWPYYLYSEAGFQLQQEACAQPLVPIYPINE